MSVAAADLIAYAAANMPDDDSSTTGGAIDTARYVDLTQIAANDTIEAVSDGADTRNLTMEGRNAGGQVVSETKALNGTTPIAFSTLGTVERVLKAELASADASRTVTIRRATGPVTIRTLGPNKRGFMLLFRKDSSDPSSGKTYYMKFFFKNEHGTLALLNAVIDKTVDAAGKIDFALAASKGDSGTVANRTTSPGLTFNNTQKAVPGTDLAAGENIGVWVRLSLNAGDAAIRNTVTFQIAGSST